jgi:hypothetical protein
MKYAYKFLVDEPEGNRLLCRLRHRKENNIKVDLMEVGCEGVDWIQLAQDRCSVGSL